MSALPVNSSPPADWRSRPIRAHEIGRVLTVVACGPERLPARLHHIGTRDVGQSVRVLVSQPTGMPTGETQ
jgi:hypothetical protein